MGYATYDKIKSFCSPVLPSVPNKNPVCGSSNTFTALIYQISFDSIYFNMAISNGTNGTKAGKPFPPGVHVPSLTWFSDNADQEIDWDVQKKHLSFLIESGLHGIVLAGTNGEAVTLSPSEKSRLVRTTRQLATQLGRPELTVILGCGGGSTRQVIEETRLAKEAGADFALVLVPSYFHFAMNEDAIIAFFEEVRIVTSLLHGTDC